MTEIQIDYIIIIKQIHINGSEIDLSSKKKKKKNQPQSAAQKPEETPKAAELTAEEEENIPVQSFSEMMAFSDDDFSDEPSVPEPAAEEKTEEKPEEKPAPKAEEEKKPEPVKKPAANTADALTSGPLISEAEAARRASAEDALDRDLAVARKKKLQEEAYNKRQRDMEMKKEAERLARAEQAKQRQENVQEMARKREQLKEAQAAIASSEAKARENAAAAAAVTKKVNRKFNNVLLSMKAGKALLVVIILLILAYCGAFVYAGSKNDEFYSELETKLNSRSQIVESTEGYQLPKTAPLTAEEKAAAGLYEFLPDSDSDGLSDEYEIKISATDPLNPDCDDDGVLDGRELRAELDPLSPSTDGTTPDSEVIKDITVTEKNVAAQITGIPKTAYTSLSKLRNNSVQGTPGLVGYAYEFYTDKKFDTCTLTFSYTDKEAIESGINESALSVYRFDAEKLLFEKLASRINPNGNTVSAEVTENGVYALCDSSVLMRKGSTNIFFLIDNSGSMYPQELCANSEENDVEFKRLDFAVNLMDMLGDEANYGAGEFSGSYSRITPISKDRDTVKQKISDIRNKNQIFSGTEIAGAVTSAVAEFGNISPSDKNYLILLTDGMPSAYNETAEKAAVELAKSKGVTIFTIGLGKEVDTEYLFNIAEDTNGQFFQASNADALENIYDKIQSFMSYNQVTIEEESGRKGYVVADSGFNVLKDGIGYSNFRTDFAPDGADYGIAGLIRAYYTGNLSLTQKGYTSVDGKAVEGYDISAVSSFTDSKADLSNVHMDILDAYNQYLAIPDKWDFGKVRGGLLSYTDDTREFIESHMMKVITVPYEFEAPEADGLTDLLRTITFSQLKSFGSYESVILDSTRCQGNDLAIMNMINWFGNYHNSGKCRVYDFGYEGDAALDALVNELTRGSPAVIVYGGTAMNAVRIVRDSLSPDLFVIDAYDSNSPERSTKIYLTRSPVYDANSVPTYQYMAYRGSEPEALKVIVSD